MEDDLTGHYGTTKSVVIKRHKLFPSNVTGLPPSTPLEQFLCEKFPQPKGPERRLTELPVDDVCALCNNDARISNKKFMFFECDNRFHEECIMKWYETHNNCPACNAELNM
jgi:hypothetical protein